MLLCVMHVMPVKSSNVKSSPTHENKSAFIVAMSIIVVLTILIIKKIAAIFTDGCYHNVSN